MSLTLEEIEKIDKIEFELNDLYYDLHKYSDHPMFESYREKLKLKIRETLIKLYKE